MQEGALSLMQMAKVASALEAVRRKRIPVLSLLLDPTYGGVSASYAMEADIRIATSDARIGFAGPEVILNTMCDRDQAAFDKQCPPDFQSASHLYQHGQLDVVVESEPKESMMTRVEDVVSKILYILTSPECAEIGLSPIDEQVLKVTDEEKAIPFNYTRARDINRPQVQDIINELFTSFVELSGDGRVGRDCCIRGGLALFEGKACIVLGTYKGHTPQTMQEANYGMASPHGYRTALRLMRMAEHFKIPVITLVDTVGAWPTFECENDGQSEAIATNLTAMSSLTVPIVPIFLGEGGSGGALGIGMGNIIGMCSGGYFGVISPEGAASILGRYDNDAHKAQQFQKDCQDLATAQCIYAHQLEELGIIDEIIWESATPETYTSFPVMGTRIKHFIRKSLIELESLNDEEIVAQRYQKFRSMGKFSLLDNNNMLKAMADAKATTAPPKKIQRIAPSSASLLIKHLAEEIISGERSRFRKLAPPGITTVPPSLPTFNKYVKGANFKNAKTVLDSEGPIALASWVKSQSRVLITDTTMRDAHQSLLATRVRTEDLIKGAVIANDLLKEAFSLESWGGATFDVAMRFLDECPWERLRELRKACPDICLQMLIRGANAVGYTSYPDNAVTEFVKLSAANGIDVFRIFDCFNIIESMQVAIDAVRAVNKVAEVCLCYSGDVLTSEIYNLEYYKSVAKEAAAAGAHIIGIKDMAGLLRPLEAGPLLKAVREVTDLPIHFHTHATSSGSLATCMEMARHGCDIIDFCTASMADGTSQPSLNAFCAMMQGAPNDTDINFLSLEPYDMYWSRVRDMYSPFESGMKSGSARVYEHQIPGGQYSNLIVQCQSMGLWDRWEEVLDAYRDVNKLLGDIVKVTPSSKCVGDLALYLVTRNVNAADLLDPAKAGSIDFPDSVVGLLKGELGFPHRGFPAAVEAAILKGSPKLTIRAGLALPPIDFQENIKDLSKKFQTEISPEQGMSSIMYPKVFSDYMTRLKAKSRLLRYLPSPVYLYAMEPGQKFTMNVPSTFANEVIHEFTPSSETTEVTIELRRVGPLKSGKRNIVFSVNGKEQSTDVRDSAGEFIFEGPMAEVGKISHIASPMPGAIEKLLVKEGQSVKQGDTLCTVSAMKMEVKVTSPMDGTIKSLAVSIGTRVVEGALLMEM